MYKKNKIDIRNWFFLTIATTTYILGLIFKDASAVELAHGNGMQGKMGRTPSTASLRPEIPEALPNITVAVGREAILPCVVKNLKDYKVAFVHIDRQMILTIHNHVITRIPRFSISHDKHLTWTLKIEKVTEEDKGFYMCQVNTDPMVSTVGHLDVVVPPNIIDEESSPSSVTIRENHNASLQCSAEGTPKPTITWRREDQKKIILKKKKNAGKKERIKVTGEQLDLIRVSRTEMGAYLCIAQNKVPPSISKRIILNVEFEPMIWIPNQLVGAPIGSNVTLECHTDSSPKAIAYWIFNNNMVLNSATHWAEDQFHSMYKLDSRLHIKNLQSKDFGSYKCVSKNSLGETEGSIMLYELEKATEPPTYYPENNPSVFGEYEGDDDDDDEQDSEDEESINDKDLDESNNRKVFDIMMTNLNNGANKYGYSNKDGERRKNKHGQGRYDNNNDANQDDRRQSKRLKNDRKRGNRYFNNSSPSLDNNPKYLSLAIVTVVLTIFQVVQDSLYE